MSTKIRFDKVTIRVSELQTTIVTVAPWETALLQAMYGEEATVTGHEVVERAAPEAADEFQRLATRYGPKNEDTPIVAAVYGKFGPGVRALDQAIGIASGRIAKPVQVQEVVAAPVELTDDEIDAIAAAGDAKQAEIDNADLI